MVCAGSRFLQQDWATCEVMLSAESGTKPSILLTASFIHSVCVCVC